MRNFFFYNPCFFRRYHATLKLEGNDEGLYSHLSTSKLHSENILAVKLGLSELWTQKNKIYWKLPLNSITQGFLKKLEVNFVKRKKHLVSVATTRFTVLKNRFHTSDFKNQNKHREQTIWLAAAKVWNLFFRTVNHFVLLETFFRIN